jgi:hypothetical protein
MENDQFLKMILPEEFCSDVLALTSDLGLRENKKVLQLTLLADGANSSVNWRCRIKLTVKDLILLYEIRDVLSPLLRLHVEDLYERRVSRIRPREVSWENYRDKLYALESTSNWKVGRIGPRLIRILREMRVFISQEPTPKRKHRLRTPSAASGSGKTSSSYRPKISNEEAWEEEQKRNWQDLTGQMLEEATHLLALERSGEMTTSELQEVVGVSAAQEQALQGNQDLADRFEREYRCRLLDNPMVDDFVAQVERPDRCELFCPRSTQDVCRLRSSAVPQR